MNEQIKALMGQTLDEKFSGTWSTMDMQDLQKFAERFAEKIVRECMCISDSIGEHGYIAAEEMGKHFGVEK